MNFGLIIGVLAVALLFSGCAQERYIPAGQEINNDDVVVQDDSVYSQQDMDASDGADQDMNIDDFFSDEEDVSPPTIPS